MNGFKRMIERHFRISIHFIAMLNRENKSRATRILQICYTNKIIPAPRRGSSLNLWQILP